MIQLKSDKEVTPFEPVRPNDQRLKDLLTRSIFGTNYNVRWFDAKTHVPYDVYKRYEQGMAPTEDIEFEDVTHKRLGE